jgi:hypothetical protein
VAEPDPIDELIVAELGRATAECLRLQARLAAMAAESHDRHTAEERAHLENLLALTEQRREQLERLAAGLKS